MRTSTGVRVQRPPGSMCVQVLQKNQEVLKDPVKAQSAACVPGALATAETTLTCRSGHVGDLPSSSSRRLWSWHRTTAGGVLNKCKWSDEPGACAWGRAGNG